MAQEHTGQPVRLLVTQGLPWPDLEGTRQPWATTSQEAEAKGLAEAVMGMAARMREHIHRGRLLDAWAAADWLEDLAGQVKAGLPVSSDDIIQAIEEGGAPQLRGVLRQQAAQDQGDQFCEAHPGGCPGGECV